MITTDELVAWAKLPAPNDDDLAVLEQVVAAVEAHIRSVCVSFVGEDDVEVIPAPVKLAALMLGARQAKRRYSVEGVVGLDDYGVVRITARDADIEMLL